MRTLARNLFAFAVLCAGAGAHAQDAATVKLYKAQCATCHGMDGRGQTTAGKKVGTKDWGDPKVLKEMSDDDVVKAIQNGKKGDDGKELMPSFSKLGDDKIKALVAYIRTLQTR